MGDELDDLLERGLRTYSAAEPLTGLEGRVVAKVRGVEVRRRGLVWSLAGGLAVVSCLALVLSWYEGQAGEPVCSTRTPVSARPTRRGVTTVTSVASLGGRNRARVRVTKPRVPVARMTVEEALLVRFVTADPEGAAKLLADLNEPTRPLVLEPIRIESLEFRKEGDDETDLAVDHGSGR